MEAQGIDLSLLDKYADEGMVSIQAHPATSLFIFNYTPKVQYGKLWDDVTLQCRGLIMDASGVVVARPFRKFFNLEELTADQIPAENFEVFDKMDGSLGILYWIGYVPYIATRGSFMSTQAQYATALLHTKYEYLWAKLNRDYTYLFEIIYPENRIVVDYGTMSDLVLLAIIDTASGIDQPLVDIGFPVVKRYDAVADYQSLKAIATHNAEGFVIKFASGFRCKIKFDEYVRLHRILTGVSNVLIWEYLADGKSFDELLDRVPDEFYKWVKLTHGQLVASFDAIESACKASFKVLPTRKESALYFQTQSHPAVLFKMLDGQPYDSIIWKAIRPKYAKAFTVDHE